MKPISMMTLMLFVAVAAGCATVDMNTEGSEPLASAQTDFEQQLASNSQGQ